MLLGVLLVCLTLLGVALRSRYAAVTVLYDGLRAAMILVPAALAGLWLVPLLWRGPIPRRWHFLLGSAMGLGLFSILVLLLGMAGFLQRPVWITILVLLTIAGVARLRALSARVPTAEAPSGKAASRERWWSLLWLAACPFAVLALLAASNAPGFIWQEEGFGYDVLEYHLQVPKEYYQAGVIRYLPHNVYANFPCNVEMFYLAAMVVHDDVSDIGTAANMIHLGLAALTVFAAWVAGREWSPAAGHVCGVAVATAGWLAYLSGLAYVENGMLFFGMAAAALVMRSIPRSNEPPRDARGSSTWSVERRDSTKRISWAAGLLAGFACGCKYTAVALVAGPLLLVIVLYGGRSARERVAGALLFVASTGLAFSPWMVKNVVTTGNPVFPLANRVFQASPPGWGAAETQAWNRGHALAETDGGVLARVHAAWDHTAGDRYQRFGPAILLIALGGWVRRRRGRLDAALLILLGAQLIVWLSATHLFARFAVVMLIPLALLCGLSVTGRQRQAGRRILATVLIAGAGWNLAFAVRLHGQESPGSAPSAMFYDGQLAGYEYLRAVNHDLPDNAKVLLVGDARAFYYQRRVDYCVVFNRNPFFAEATSSKSPRALLAWLRERGYSHVLVHWAEIRRLASTYGFSPPVGEATLLAVFDRLEEAGLERIRSYPAQHSGDRYVDLYALAD